MKILNLCLALVFSLSLSLMVAPDNSFAASSDSKSTVSKASSSAKKATEKVSKVNINSADKQTLTQLPGVGPATADAIVKYRKANGKFTSANDLLNVKGIGEKTLSKMKPLLKF